MILQSSILSAAPDIQVKGEARVEVGEHLNSENQKATFEILNKGDATLVISRLKKTCGCSDASISAMSIPPGKSAITTVTLDGKQLHGTYTKSIYVESNDPDTPALRLSVSGTSKEIVQVSPQKSLYLGNLPMGAGTNVIFTIRSEVEELKLGAPVYKSKRPAKSALTYNEATKSYKLVVRIEPGGASGVLNYTATLPVIAPANIDPIHLIIRARIGAELYAARNVILVRPSEKPVEERFNIRLIGEAGTLISHETLQISGPAGMKLRPNQTAGTSSVHYIATLQPALIQRVLDEREIPITFGLKGAASTTILLKGASPRRR